MSRRRNLWLGASGFLVTVGLGILLFTGGAEVWAQGTGSRGVMASRKACGTTITTLISANPNRINLTLINVGTIHIGLGGQMHTAAQLATAGFYSFHAGSALEFANFQGGLTCTADGPVQIEVLEEIR
jgi:hypothetical protein